MRLKLSSIALVAAALVAMPASVSSVQAQNARLQGTFTYDAASSDDINQAIESAISRMNFVTRPIARGRLRKTNQPYRTIRLSFTPSQISVITDTRDPIVSPANGTPIKWTREDGEVLDVATSWRGGAIEQSFTAEDGKRVNSYSLSADGDVMTMHVTITSPRLAAPLRYNLRYRRQG